MIDVLFLGNGAMMPLPDRWLSSALVRVRDEVMLLDCGEGTQIPWRRTGWGFKRLSLICLSHTHADHVAGLPGILHAVAIAGRERPLRIVGPAGTEAVVDGLRVIAPDLPFKVQVEELADGDDRPAIAGMSLRVIEGEHRVPVLLYRFDLPRSREFIPDRAVRLGVPRERWGEFTKGEAVSIDGRVVAYDDVHGPDRTGISFGFATDTRPVASAAPFFRDVDMLVCEGTYGDDADAENAVRNKHMTFREAATVAANARVGSLVLTHFSPKMGFPDEWIGNAVEVFQPVGLAQTGWARTLSFPARGQTPIPASR